MFFDAETSKHSLDVEFTEAVSQALQQGSDAEVISEDVGGCVGSTSDAAGENRGSDHRGDSGKKLWGSPVPLAASQKRSVTVE